MRLIRLHRSEVSAIGVRLSGSSGEGDPESVRGPWPSHQGRALFSYENEHVEILPPGGLGRKPWLPIGSAQRQPRPAKVSH